MKHRQLRGVEDGLVGYWKFDESIGSTTIADSTASHLHSGTLTGAVALTGSTAYLGGTTHLIPSLDFANLMRSYVIANSPAQSGFPEPA